jgi:Fe2+ or Zn2+ uptake regulation protein
VAGEAVTDDRAVVLELLLEAYPALLSTAEILQSLTAPSESFAERDRVDVALNELVEAGLAHRIEVFAFASRAACTFARLRAG